MLQSRLWAFYTVHVLICRVHPPWQVSVKGMHCSSCSSAVERVLSSQPGVTSANVALLNETAEVSLGTLLVLWEGRCNAHKCGQVQV